MPDLKRGVFIAIEGVDGAGSTTQTQMLVSLLKSKGFDAVQTKEPNPRGEVEPLIRRLLASGAPHPALDALLFAADRVQHTEEVIKPYLEAKKIVVSDRYLESSLAYQVAQGLNPRWVSAINRYAVKPDLTIILDIDPQVSLRRKPSPPERFENAEFLAKVRTLFLQRARTKKYEVIDASMAIDEVHTAVVKATLPLLVSASGINRRP